MNGRPKSGLVVAALIRAAEAAGGFAMVLRKGDADAGSILLATLEKGRNSSLFERQWASDRGYAWVPIWTQDTENKDNFHDILERLHARDPDLWVVELNVPNVERFIAEWSLIA